jgi:hypothetical protein
LADKTTRLCKNEFAKKKKKNEFAKILARAKSQSANSYLETATK